MCFCQLNCDYLGWCSQYDNWSIQSQIAFLHHFYCLYFHLTLTITLTLLSPLMFCAEIRLLSFITPLLYHPTQVKPPLALINSTHYSSSVSIFISESVSWSIYSLHDIVISPLLYNWENFKEENSLVFNVPLLVVVTVIECLISKLLILVDIT